MSATNAPPMQSASSTSHTPASFQSHHTSPIEPTFPSWYPALSTKVPSHPCRLYFLPLPSSTPPARPQSALTRGSLSLLSPLPWSPPVADLGRVLALIDTACNNGFSGHHILRQKSLTHSQPPTSEVAAGCFTATHSDVCYRYCACSDYLSELVSNEVEKDLSRRDIPAPSQPAVFNGQRSNKLSHTAASRLASVEWCEEACELLSSMHSNYHARFNQQSDAANHVKRARPTKRGRTRTAKAHQDGRYPLHFSEHTDISAVPDSATVNVPSACCVPYVLLEWQLFSSRSQSILPSVDVLHSHFASHNAAILQTAAASHQAPPLPLPPPTFSWSNILASEVLPLLTLPDTNLPPLPGIELPKAGGQRAARVLARHCWTHTTQSTHKVMDVVLLPIELILLDDDEQSEDRRYLADTLTTATTDGDATTGSEEGGAAAAESYEFGMQWELYEQSSKVRAVRAAERLCEDFVMTRLGSSKRSVFVNDSEVGRDTARFMQTFTPFEFNPQTLPLKSLPRTLTRLLSAPGGHTSFVLGPLSLLAPLCLALLNGGQLTDTIVPREEIRALFLRRQLVHLTVWDPNPTLAEHTEAVRRSISGGSRPSSRGEREVGSGSAADTARSSATVASLASLTDDDGGAGVGGSSGGVSSSGGTADPLNVIALMSWTLSQGDDSDMQLSEEERSLKRLSRQRTHVHGGRKTVPIFTPSSHEHGTLGS